MHFEELSRCKGNVTILWCKYKPRMNWTNEFSREKRCDFMYHDMVQSVESVFQGDSRGSLNPVNNSIKWKSAGGINFYWKMGIKLTLEYK